MNEIDWTATAKAALVWSISSLAGPLILVASFWAAWKIATTPREVLKWITG